MLHSYVCSKIAFHYSRQSSLNVRSSEMIWIRIDDHGPRPLGSWCIKETEWPKVYGFTVLLIHHGPSDPWSLILIWMQQKWNSVKTTWIMQCIKENDWPRLDWLDPLFWSKQSYWCNSMQPKWNKLKTIWIMKHQRNCRVPSTADTGCSVIGFARSTTMQ